MPGLEDFFRSGIMLFLGDTLGLFHAILSILGVLMIIISVLGWGIGMLTGAKFRAPIMVLILGFVICSIFGFSYGLNYFDIVV